MGAPIGLSARLSKLKAMSARELVSRVRYKAALAWERRQHRHGTLARPGRLRDALRRDLRSGDWRAALLDARRRTPARFFAGARDRDALRSLFHSEYRAELEQTLVEASRAERHVFEFFGQEFAYGDAIEWQRDPVSKRDWPARFHADVPVHGGDVGYGDVKHVWELSRQQYLIDIGKAFFLTGDTRHLGTLESLVRGWIEGNPYGTGVNWACALEPAFRAWSWLWAYHLTEGALSDDFHAQWLEAFYDHGRFLRRHLEHHSSPYNHLIGEASALFVLGHAFPEFADAPAWRREARAVLEQRLPEQFYADGGTVEQSTFYHHATVGFYLLAALAGRDNGEELAPPVWRAIERGLEFSMQVMQPDGRIPAIGGADDGKPIRLEHLPFWDFRPYQAIGAVVFDRPDFKAVSGRFYEDALWLLGNEGLSQYRTMSSRFPDATAVMLPASGYAIARSGWSPDANYVCVDAGEQAAGMRTDAIPNSMHGHADCLSIVVSLAGEPVLVDSGLFAYNCGGAWENHFRETAAHNTARIDGRDQARHIAKMAWSHSYRPRIEAHREGRGTGWVSASHDGYARGPQGVTHKRVVWLAARGYVLVWDEFTGDGTHDIEVNYQFAPGSLAAAGPGTALFEDRVDVAWSSRAAWSAAIAHGGESPDRGWICPSLGVRQPAPRLSLTTRTASPRTTLLTILARRWQAAPRIRMTSGTSDTALHAVDDASGVDWVAAGAISDGGPIATEAPLAIVRLSGDGVHAEAAGLDLATVGVDTTALTRLTQEHHPA